MAKAVRNATPAASRAGASTRAERSNYFADVVSELRKVVWPTWELRRMTGIVILTVIILAVIIGIADLLLSIAVKQLYVQSGSTTIQNFQNQTVTTTATGATTSTISTSTTSSVTTTSSASSASSTTTH